MTQTVSQKGQQLCRHCRTPSKSLASEGHSGTFQASHFRAVAVAMDVYTQPTTTQKQPGPQ